MRSQDLQALVAEPRSIFRQEIKHIAAQLEECLKQANGNFLEFLVWVMVVVMGSADAMVTVSAGVVFVLLMAAACVVGKSVIVDDVVAVEGVIIGSFVDDAVFAVMLA